MIGVSVVPTSAWPCHGIANITRPSDVCGTMIAASDDRKEWSNTRWIPWLGAISVSASGSASRRTESENAPVALTITRAVIVHCRPVS